MKFTIDSKTLKAALSQIGALAKSNTVLSILGDFLFELKEGMLHVHATDLQTYATKRLEVFEASGEGRICIPSAPLLTYLGKLSGPCQFDITSDAKTLEMAMKCGKSKARLAGENPSDFPPPLLQGSLIAEKHFTLSLPAEELKAGLQSVVVAISKDDLRPAMTGICIEVWKEENRIAFTATDAHRLITYSRAQGGQGSQTALVMPKDAAVLLLKLLPADGEAQFDFDLTHVVVSFEDLVISSRCIDARFPDYRAVVPKDNPYTMSINRADLIAALARVSVMGNDTTRQAILSIEDGEVTISAQDIDFGREASEVLPCRFDSDPMQIAFDATKLSELLSSLHEEELAFTLSTPTRAGLIVSEHSTSLLMPLMVDL